MSLHSPATLESEPRRIALLSDVHGNLPAFRAVLADIDAAKVDEVWCLGDVVGYGAQPDECVQLAAERCHLCLRGNHDLAALGRLDIAEFSPAAGAAARWTTQRLGGDARSFLEGLATQDETKPLGLYHASPRDPVWEYVLSTLLAGACMDAMEPRVGAVGHSHVALWFQRQDTGLPDAAPAPGGTERELSSGRWLVNPGAVGQPRDGDPRAAWLLLELPAWTAAWRRVKYPVDEAAAAIRGTDLPAVLADRLYYGQ